MSQVNLPMSSTGTLLGVSYVCACPKIVESTRNVRSRIFSSFFHQRKLTKAVLLLSCSSSSLLLPALSAALIAVPTRAPTVTAAPIAMSKPPPPLLRLLDDCCLLFLLDIGGCTGLLFFRQKTRREGNVGRWMPWSTVK